MSCCVVLSSPVFILRCPISGTAESIDLPYKDVTLWLPFIKMCLVSRFAMAILWTGKANIASPGLLDPFSVYIFKKIAVLTVPNDLVFILIWGRLNPKWAVIYFHTEIFNVFHIICLSDICLATHTGKLESLRKYGERPDRSHQFCNLVS